MSSAGSNGIVPGDDRGHDFINLYLANERRIYGFIMAMVPNWSDADDILQETTKVMWSKFDEFELGTNFLAWGMRIAKYQVLSYFNKKRGDKLKFRDETMELFAAEMDQTSDQQDDVRIALGGCIEKLRESDRKLLEMRYEQGATTKSASQKLGRKIDAVYKALNRIHNQLFHCIRGTLTMERWV